MLFLLASEISKTAAIFIALGFIAFFAAAVCAAIYFFVYKGKRTFVSNEVSKEQKVANNPVVKKDLQETDSQETKK